MPEAGISGGYLSVRQGRVGGKVALVASPGPRSLSPSAGDEMQLLTDPDLISWARRDSQRGGREAHLRMRYRLCRQVLLAAPPRCCKTVDPMPMHVTSPRHPTGHLGLRGRCALEAPDAKFRPTFELTQEEVPT